MNKDQYAEMLHDICETHKQGGDTSSCIAKYNKLYKYIYIYNDNIFKLLFGTPENESLTVDFLNAVLKLDGADCIEHITFLNPALPDAFSKSITSDIMAQNQNQDRIVLEVQHVEDGSFKSRLVLYTAKHTVASLVKGETYNLRNVNLISLQMFNGFPDSKNYRHCIQLKNQDNEIFYEKQTITLVEIPKFLKGNYEKDTSRLAQWLRVFNELNNESPIPDLEDPQFALLQEKAKLSIFTKDFLVSEAMKMSDHNYELYVEKKHARAEGLAEGLEQGRVEMALDMLADNEPIEKIVKYSHLSEEKVLKLRESQASYHD